MNHNDQVDTGERELQRYEVARHEAEQEVYQALRELLGVQGENLCMYLDQPSLPGIAEWASMLVPLRFQYRKYVDARASQIIERQNRGD